MRVTESPRPIGRFARWEQQISPRKAVAGLMIGMSVAQMGAYAPAAAGHSLIRGLLLGTSPIWLIAAVATWRRSRSRWGWLMTALATIHVALHFCDSRSVTGSAAVCQGLFGLGAVAYGLVWACSLCRISPFKLGVGLVSMGLAAAAIIMGLALSSSGGAGVGYKWSESSFYAKHPTLEHVMHPNAVQQIYYLEDPREYFEFERASNQLDARLFETQNEDPPTLQLRYPQDADGPLSISVNKPAADQNASAILFHALPQLSTGGTWRLMLEARAERLRTIRVSLVQTQPQHRTLGSVATFALMPQWNAFEMDVPLGDAMDALRLLVQVGESDVPLQLRRVKCFGPPGAQPLYPARYSVTSRTNSAGFRDQERLQSKPAGVFRIACLGDSFTFGQGVKAHDRCSDQLEQELRKRFRGTCEIEVLNFGVPGYSTRLERIQYERTVHSYQPDVVLLFVVSNDFASPVEEEAAAKARAQQQPGGWFSLRRAQWAIELFRPVDYSGCVAEILRLSELCRADGARLGVVTFGFDWQPGNRLEADISRGLAASSLPVLHLRDGLRQNHSADDLRVNEADGHPNEIAHRLAAQLVEQFLDESRLLPGGAANGPQSASRDTPPR